MARQRSTSFLSARQLFSRLSSKYYIYHNFHSRYTILVTRMNKDSRPIDSNTDVLVSAHHRNVRSGSGKDDIAMHTQTCAFKPWHISIITFLHTPVAMADHTNSNSLTCESAESIKNNRVFFHASLFIQISSRGRQTAAVSLVTS